MSKLFNSSLAKGFFKCSLCKPMRFRSGGVWLMNNRLSESEYELTYVICRDHVERILDNLQLTMFQQLSAASKCSASHAFSSKYNGHYPCCFNFYMQYLCI